MEEKIKIYIPGDVYQILLKDMELFEFYKKDGTLNKNEFLNTLIVNYYETYSDNNSKTYEYIHNLLLENNIKDYKADSISSSILSYVEKTNLNLQSKKAEVTISMKPTRRSSGTFEYIENCLLKGSSLSGWIRALLASYAHLPRDKRERIIFKERFEIIEEAISNHKKIYLSLSRKEKNMTVSPYAISSSKEELFNYLLAIDDEKGKTRSYHMSRIQNIKIINEKTSFDENTVKTFEKMISNGPQFAYQINENEITRVRLSEYGKQLYKDIYLNRPPYISIEDDVYSFECSLNQIRTYFKRFGKDAVILSPQSMVEFMKKYHKEAAKKYK
ncbi:MAG: WYL domain-containing protein [Erysipelotrichaceae bacterium]|nr:WYL domain-containing protein [Erysipelotrichaceae bacterium]